MGNVQGGLALGHPRSATRRLGRIGAAVVAVLIVVLGIVVPRAAEAGAPTPDPAADAEFLSMVNRRRSTLGRGTLQPDSHLAAVGRDWSVRMASSGELEHNPNLQRQVTHRWLSLFENVGAHDDARELFDGFVASRSHREIIDDPSFTMIGIGTVRDARGDLWTTHVFMQPASGARPPASSPKAVAAPPAAAAAPARPPAPPAPPAPAARAAATVPPAPQVAAPVPAHATVPTLPTVPLAAAASTYNELAPPAAEAALSGPLSVTTDPTSMTA
ncbi:MAG: CAP domain-containing protein, partial [Actinomycetes bacterium]